MQGSKQDYWENVNDVSQTISEIKNADCGENTQHKKQNQRKSVNYSHNIIELFVVVCSF
jgi:hypothetical protein